MEEENGSLAHPALWIFRDDMAMEACTWSYVLFSSDPLPFRPHLSRGLMQSVNLRAIRGALGQDWLPKDPMVKAEKTTVDRMDHGRCMVVCG